MDTLRLTKSRGTLAELYSGRDNAIGFIRLLLAVGVVLSHSKPLGFSGRLQMQDLGYYFFDRQTNVGTLSVYGFFVLSGLLITRSARRLSIVRYAWHRALRILPGLWVCLLVSAFVLAPLVALREHGSLNGFWTTAPGGPVSYLRANWWTGMRQFGIHDLFVATTPWGRLSHVSVFNGALWSLVYEVLCYVMIGILAVTGVIKQARRFVVFLAASTYVLIVLDYWDTGSWTAGPLTAHHSYTVVPILGGLEHRWFIYLGFLFLLGAIFELYRERIPVHDALAVLAAVVFGVTLVSGGFFLLGFPAFAYLLIWLSIRLPRRVHWVGRKNDYSYGIYIYGFLGQQLFASLNWNRWGFIPFAAISLVWAFVAAYLSWHLVEKHALSLKGWTPRLLGKRPTRPGVGTDVDKESADPGLEPASSKA